MFFNTYRLKDINFRIMHVALSVVTDYKESVEINITPSKNEKERKILMPVSRTGKPIGDIDSPYTVQANQFRG